MNQTAFDDHIKKQFSDYQPEVPSYLWDKIKGEKDHRKPVPFWMTLIKKRNGLWAGLILILGTSIIYYLNSGNQQATLTENKIVTATLPVIEKETGNNTGSTNITDIPAQNKTNDDNTMTTHSKLSQLPGKMKHTITASYAETDTRNMIAGNENEAGQVNSKTAFYLNRLLLDMNRNETEKQFSFNLQLPKMVGLPIPCPSLESNAAANKKYIEVYAGPDYAFRNLSDTGNSSYLSKRKESTKFSYGYSAGIRYTRVFNNSMSIRTGINYSQINEKFTYKEGNIVQVVYIIDNNGDTTGSYTATGTKYKSKNNRYHTADIPLIIGYEIGNGRVHANFNAGAIVNVYSWQKGEVLDTSSKPVSISTGGPTSPYQFRNNIGVGFLGSVSVYYKLNDRMHILAEPYYRYNFSSASKPELTLKQKYNTAGLRLGIRLDLP